MDRELEYIKLKVDWYKSISPWLIAMLAGEVAYLSRISRIDFYSNFAYKSVVVSIGCLLVALLLLWQCSLPLIHRLEEPYKPRNLVLRAFLWTPEGKKAEVILGSAMIISFVGAAVTFVGALVVNGMSS